MSKMKQVRGGAAALLVVALGVALTGCNRETPTSEMPPPSATAMPAPSTAMPPEMTTEEPMGMTAMPPSAMTAMPPASMTAMAPEPMPPETSTSGMAPGQ